MNSLLNRLEVELTARINYVNADEQMITFQLDDGRVVAFPVDWSPRLQHATVAERNQWELIGGGIGVHWPALDEDISLAGVLLGLRSGESKQSVERWLKARRQKHSILTD